jgi:hypothetical protein
MALQDRRQRTLPFTSRNKDIAHENDTKHISIIICHAMDADYIAKLHQIYVFVYFVQIILFFSKV